ncbi:MAG: hypothetical protein SNJ75_09245, partial [Gemmataceae bacterium]
MNATWTIFRRSLALFLAPAILSIATSTAAAQEAGWKAVPISPPSEPIVIAESTPGLAQQTCPSPLSRSSSIRLGKPKSQPTMTTPTVPVAVSLGRPTPRPSLTPCA